MGKVLLNNALTLDYVNPVINFGTTVGANINGFIRAHGQGGTYFTNDSGNIYAIMTRLRPLL